MRRILTSLLIALLLGAALPVSVFAATQATAGTATTAEDTPVTITLQARDQGGAAITSFTTTTAAHGTVGTPGPITCLSTGNHRCSSDVLYTPDANYNGADSFQFTATGPAGPDTATVSITITAVNDAPVCADDASSAQEDNQQSGTIVCTDVDGNSLTYSRVTDGTKGTATVNANGTWTYTPNANANGSDSFTFRANDGTTNSNTATMSITITPVNDAPVCSDDASSGAKNAQQSGTLACTDVDGDTLTYAKVASPSHGSASVASNGNWTYTPTNGYSGPDSFTFRANDGTVNSNTSTMSLTVSAGNSAPVCNADSSSGAEDTDQTGTLSCTDAENDTLAYSKVAGPSHGTASVASNGGWSYTPAANYDGPDSFTFKAYDGTVDSNIATMTLTVTAVNDPPVCTDDSSSGLKNVQQSGTVSTCTDIDGDPLTYAKVAGPSHGTASVASNGNWTYTPTAGYTGPDSFTFKANDGSVDSNTSTMTLTVNPSNTAPVCGADSSSGAEDSDQTGTLSCTDVDGDTLTYAKVAGPSHGTASVDPGGDWTYTPNADYHGPDSFSFRANDGALNSNTATMSITVTSVNDAPVCAPDSSSGAEDAGQAGTVSCTDVDGDTLTYAKVSDAAHGSVSVATDGGWSYTPDADYNGPDSFTFQANDGTLDSNTATLSVTVTAVNDPPVCTPDSTSGAEDTDQTGTLSCTDVDGDTLTYAKATDPSHGAVSVASDGDWTYTPDADYNGADSFTFRANDGTVNSNPVTMSITVTPVNDAPVCGADSSSGNEDADQSATVSCTDVDGDTLAYSKVGGPSHGTASVAANGDWTYTPDADYHGPDSFTFKANDGTVDSNTATLSITVVSVNDPPVCDPLSVHTVKNVPVDGAISCTDVEGDALTYRIGTQPTQGDVTAFDTSTGEFTYTPDPGVGGADTFTIIANDGAADSAPALVGVGVDNHAPSCSDATPAAANEDTQQAANLSCTDADSDTLAYSIRSQPAHGTAAINASTGHWTYTPDADYNGADSFTAGASDGADPSNDATIDLTIDPVNDAPRCTTVVSSGDEDTQQAGDLSPSCLDVDAGGPLTYAMTTGAAHGTATINTDGTWSYSPAANYNGTDSFKFTATNDLTSAPATVSLTIVDVNDPPIAANDSKTVTATTTTTISVTSNDKSGPSLSGGEPSEPGDSITVTGVTAPVRGSASIAPGATSVIYDPRGCLTGGDIFGYTITDSHGKTANANVFVTVARPGTSHLSKNPITDTPNLGFIAGSTIGSSTTPMRLTWCGVTASGTSVKAYRVDQSTNGGSSYKVLLSATKSTSSTRNLGNTTRFRWRIRTTDKAGRTGGYKTSLVARLARVQDSSSSIAYTGPWSATSTSSASGGSMRTTSTAGADATMTLASTVRAFAIVGPRSSTRGSFQVWVDGTLVVTVSEKVSGSTQNQRVVYTRGVTAGTTHTVRIVAVGNGRIDLDAIVTLGT